MVPTRRRGSPFYRQGNDWFCNTGLPSDIVIEVDAVSFHLHKFPLMSKCGKIARMVEESEKMNQRHHTLAGCPGGSEAFCLAAKFCYGAIVDLMPTNVLLAYCLAEYLEMNEEYGEDNLLAKAESFLHKVILRSWKDCILALHSIEQAISRAETLQIIKKCLNAVAMMVCTDPSLFGWPMMMYGTLQSPGGSILWNGINTGARIRSSVSDWWFEDISCLGVPMFKRLIETMKERGIRPENIAGALMYYARKYLPGLDRWQTGHGGRTRDLTNISAPTEKVDQKVLLESLEAHLPEKKGRSYCRFLLGLLRVAMILNVCETCKDSLERKVGMQLEFAALDGLLIPSFSDSDTLYDTDCFERILRHFLSTQISSVALFSPASVDCATSHSSSALRRVTKLIDAYLAEIAPDVNLKPDRMHYLVEALPESLRPLDDGLYRALDIYFKAHPWLSENEREQLCSTIEYRRLSIDACTHASHNERLPIRVVLQALFFEQLKLRAAVSNCLHVVDSGNDVSSTANDLAVRILQRDGWVSLVRENQVLRLDMERMTSRVWELEREFTGIKQEMGRISRPHGLISSNRFMTRKFGCMKIAQLDDPHIEIVDSISASPRQPLRQPHLPDNTTDRDR